MDEEVKETIEPNIGLTLQYDDENNLFMMRFLNGENAVFQVKLTIETFTALSADMIRIIKDYNLMRAKEYTRKKDEEEKRAIGCDQNSTC